MSDLYIVTGALGFIGSSVINQLIKSKANIFALDIGKARNSKRHNAQLLYPQIKHFFDCLPEPAIIAKFKKITVIHCAYSTSHHLPIHSLSECVNDLQFLCQLIELLIDRNEVDVRFLSSSAVYKTPSKNRINEKSPINSSNPYSFMKLSSEQIIEYYSRNFSNISSIIFRLFTCYGSEQSPETLIGKLLLSKQGGTKVQLYKRGSQIRDFIHVEDIVSAVTMSFNLNDDYNIFNLSGDDEISILEFAERLGANFELIGDEDRNDIIVGDSSKLKKLLNWRPIYSIHDI